MATHETEKEPGKPELSVQRLQTVKGQVEAVSLGYPHLEQLGLVEQIDVRTFGSISAL